MNIMLKLYLSEKKQTKTTALNEFPTMNLVCETNLKV